MLDQPDHHLCRKTGSVHEGRAVDVVYLDFGKSLA